jgi:hypothetical protein
VQGIRNARSEKNLLEEDKDVMRESIKSCVLDNTFMSDIVLYYGENSSKDMKVLLLEPKLVFEFLHPLLQKLQMSVTSKDIKEFELLDNWSGDTNRLLKYLESIPNFATYFAEYG